MWPAVGDRRCANMVRPNSSNAMAGRLQRDRGYNRGDLKALVYSIKCLPRSESD